MKATETPSRITPRALFLALTGLAGIAAFSTGFWWYLQPMQSAKDLGYAALGHHYRAIEKAIDYPALKVNMAHNLHRIIAQNNNAHHLHIKAAWITAAANNGAANMATPERVRALLTHVLPEMGPKLGIRQYTGQFLSWNRYAVLVTAESGGHIRAIFYRQGFATWKLGDIEMFPPHMPLDAYPKSATVEEVRNEAPAIQSVGKAASALATIRPSGTATSSARKVPAG